MVIGQDWCRKYLVRFSARAIIYVERTLTGPPNQASRHVRSRVATRVPDQPNPGVGGPEAELEAMSENRAGRTPRRERAAREVWRHGASHRRVDGRADTPRPRGNAVRERGFVDDGAPGARRRACA